MPDTRPSNRATALHSAGEEHSQTLRQLGSRAHQLRAATRAADHYNALDKAEDRDTGSWLISCALGLADDLACDINGLARSFKEGPAEAASQQAVAGLRVRAHQLHAAVRAADHFLDQETNEDRDTGSWLIACALGLATKLAAEIDDCVAPARRAVVDKEKLEPHDAQLARRVAAASTPIRGAA